MAKKVKQLDNTKLEDLFHRHHYNKSGTIDYKEIKPMLKELGYSEAAIEGCSLDMNFLIQGDKDGDSQLSLEEFLDLMHKLAGTSGNKKKK